MKILILCLTTFLVLAGCTSMMGRVPTAVQPVHYIMTLHGVRGNEVSFGDFHKLIKTHLENVDPAYKVVPINMTYKTGQTDFSPHHAADEINQKLDQLIPILNPEDKISVLAYSMGGQVGMIWYYDSLKSEKYKKYPLQTVKFMSLGAPYYGSKEASLGTSADNIFGQLDINKVTQNILAKYSLLGKVVSAEQARTMAQDAFNRARAFLVNFGTNYNRDVLPYAKISFAEMQALAIDSDVTNEIRLNKINTPTKTKWVSLSSLVSCIETDLTTDEPGCQSFQNDLFKNLNADVFGKYTFGYKRRETDNSVITPSANAQFIYAVENDKNYTDGQLTALNQFRYTGNEMDHHFYLAEGLHATVIPASLYEKALGVLGKAGNSWKGLADDVVLVYEKDCKNPETCKHPAYKYILAEFADCDRAGSTCVADKKAQVVDAFFTNKVNHDELEQKVLKSELHGFTVDFNIRVPKGYDLSQITHQNLFNYLRLNFSDSVNHVLLSSPTWPYQIQLARPTELGSLLMSKVTRFSDQDQLRITMTGLIIPKNGDHYDYAELEKGSYFNLNINLPGLKARKLQPLVRPYYSTYVDVVMAPASQQ